MDRGSVGPAVATSAKERCETRLGIHPATTADDQEQPREDHKHTGEDEPLPHERSSDEPLRQRVDRDYERPEYHRDQDDPERSPAVKVVPGSESVRATTPS